MSTTHMPSDSSTDPRQRGPTKGQFMVATSVLKLLTGPRVLLLFKMVGARLEVDLQVERDSDSGLALSDTQLPVHANPS